VDIDRGESLCPLCKTITNTLLPHITRSADVGANGPYVPSQAPTYRDGAVQTHLAGGGASGASKDRSFLPLAWMREQPGLQSCLETIQSCFARHLDRGKLSSDNMFYSSCALQYKPSWDPNARDGSVTRNVTVLRAQHSLWSTTAYTLMTAINTSLRERSSSTSSSHTTSDAVPVKLSDLDNTTVTHLVGLSWRSSAWMKHFNSFVSDALSDLFVGQSDYPAESTTGPKAASSPLDQFLTKATAKKADLQRSLLSMPFESFGSGCYPNSCTTKSLGRLAMEKGVPEREAWPFLKVPLLAQDLHIIAVAAVSSAEDLQAFCTINQLLCVARLAQSLLEPVVTGAQGVRPGVQPISKGSGSPQFSSLRAGGKSEAKHSHPSDLDTAGSASKRSKHTQEEPSASSLLPGVDSLPHGTDTPADDAQALLTLRELVCREAGVHVAADALHGASLVDLILDSWVPYLEYALHLQCALGSLSGAEPPLHVPDAAAALPMEDRVRELHEQLHLPSFHELASHPFFRELVTAWARHFKVYNGFVAGGEHGEYFTPGVPVPWIPTKRSSSHSSPMSTTASSGKQAGSTQKRSPPPQRSQLSGRSPMQSPQQSAYDLALRATVNMVLGEARAAREARENEQQAPTGAATETGQRRDGQTEQERGEVESDGEDDMQDAMEEGQDVGGVLSDVPMEEDATREEEGADANASEAADRDGQRRRVPQDVYYSIMEAALAQEARQAAADRESSDDEWVDAAEEAPGQAEGLGGDLTALLEAASGMGGDATDGSFAQLLASFSSQARAGGQPSTGAPAWKLLGVYPINPTVDFPAASLDRLVESLPERDREHGVSNYLQLLPVRAPLQGSLTGTHPVVGYNGDVLRHGFPDLSHLGLGMRHLTRCFVDLPNLYTDLYQMVCTRCIHCLLSFEADVIDVLRGLDEIPCARGQGQTCRGGPRDLPALRPRPQRR
jgi:hypothetical protein